jgi:hypothetical protein
VKTNEKGVSQTADPQGQYPPSIKVPVVRETPGAQFHCAPPPLIRLYISMEKLMSDQMPKASFNVRMNPLKESYLLVQRNQAFEIDEVGATIWNLCDGDHTLQQIAETLSQEYDVDVSEALQDVNEFVVDLRSKGLIQ